MKPDRYEISQAGRHRPSGLVQRRGGRLDLPAWGGFLFGLPFAGAGTAILLLAVGVLKADRASVHAPMWVLGVAGLVFLAAGLMLWGLTAKQVSASRKRAQAMRDHPGSVALEDFNWDVRSWRVSGWVTAFKALLVAAGITLFLSMFNWWAFAAKGPFMVKIIVGVFDLIALCLWWNAIHKVACALKFGESELLYTRFPYSLVEPVIVRWKPWRGVSRIEQGQFKLRCVEQWMEQSGAGKNRNTTVVQEELWSASWFIDQPRNFQLGEMVELTFELPGAAESTRLNADRNIFWEVEVQLKIPGLDFKERYLVPVYA